jgi:hypothetical protein
MGLIATFHLPLTFGIPLIKLDPFEWILGPELLLEVITKEKCTLTWLPNFAYNVLADKIYDDELPNFDLSSLRMVINCSEPIRFHSHELFFNKFKSCGFKKSALSTCYAMAETTFAVTQTPPDTEPKIIKADVKLFNRGIIESSEKQSEVRICVSSGRLIEGCEIKIVNEKNEVLPDGRIGEIAIKSISMFDGYRNYPEKTSEVLKDGWYYSGDLGFCYDGEYYIIGRKKDVIIVAGKNIYPEDIEDAVNNIKGVIPGRVIAFGEDNEELGTQEVNIIAETSITEEEEKKKLISEIRQLNTSLEISIKNIYLVPPKWLIKSSAGKPSRNANKERILTAKNKLLAKITRVKRFSYGVISLALIFLILAFFFLLKNAQTNILVSELVNDTLPYGNNFTTDKKVMLLSQKIFNETNKIVDPDKVDWYSLFEVKNLWGMTAAIGLEYKCYAIDKIGEPDKSNIMTRILLLSLWESDIPARRLILNDSLNNKLFSLAEYYSEQKWKVVSVADSAFLWLNRYGKIATTDEIKEDSTILSQIYNYNPEWNYSLDYISHVNWDILPASIKYIVKAIIGDASFENTESPKILERPRKLAFALMSIISLIFIIAYYRLNKKLKVLISRANSLQIF